MAWLMYMIAKLFNNSRRAKHFISYKRPDDIIHVYGFQVKLITQFQTSMHGSGEGHTCYIFRRIGACGVGAEEECHGFPCDRIFRNALETCMGGYDVTKHYVDNEVKRFYQEKPNRVHKSIIRLTYS